MIDPNKVYQKLSTAGHAWAEADSQAWQAEELLKSRRAEVYKVYRASGSSIGDSEQESRCDPGYVEAVKGYARHREAAAKAKVEWIAMQAWVELVRTTEASRRAEMKL